MADAMRLAIVGINYAPEEVGIARYSTEMAVALAARGTDVEVIAGIPYYPAWEVAPTWRGLRWRRGVERGVRITRCPHYVPSDPSGPKRILHLASFALSALVPGIALAFRPRAARPQVVMCVAPAMLSIATAWIIARLCGARLWVHVQDFEVEAAFATDLVRADGLAGKLARQVENTLLALADKASSISPQMCAKLVEKGVPAPDVTEVRNWADSNTSYTTPEASLYRAQWGLGTRKVCLYSGNIANKQGIEILIEVASLLRHRHDIAFVICGQGPNRQKLAELAQGLDNLQLHDLQPMDMMGDLLGLATLHLLPQIPGAADLLLPSKLTNMLASGRPVVTTADKGTGLYDEVDGCGLAVEPGNAPAMATAIERLIDDQELAASSGVNARHRARERWSQDGVIRHLASTLHDLVPPVPASEAPPCNPPPLDRTG